MAEGTTTFQKLYGLSVKNLNEKLTNEPAAMAVIYSAIYGKDFFVFILSSYYLIKPFVNSFRD